MTDPQASGTSRRLNILQVCDHLGWEGSRMHGVKRLFAWMIPRFDKSRFNVSLVSLRKKDLSEETLESFGVDITYLHKGRQYVTIASGRGGGLANRYAADITPAGGAVWTFAVME